MKIRNELFTTDEILNFRRSFTLKNLDLEPLDNTRIELIIVLTGIQVIFQIIH